MTELSRKIVKYPNDILRRKTRKIENFRDERLTKLVFEMLKTLEDAKGVGLAAPQVGSGLRVCVIRVNNELYILANPEIKTYSRKKETAEEGCLSFPEKYFAIERPVRVKVRAQDLSGKKIRIKADGLLSRALQHEIDHLNGVLIIDRANPKIGY